MYRNIVFLYTNSSKGEIKKTIPFSVASKIIKYLRINLSTEVKYMYSENYNTLIKEIQDNTYMEGYNVLMNERINIVKMFLLPKAINRFSAIPI